MPRRRKADQWNSPENLLRLLLGGIAMVAAWFGADMYDDLKETRTTTHQQNVAIADLRSEVARNEERMENHVRDIYQQLREKD